MNRLTPKNRDCLKHIAEQTAAILFGIQEGTGYGSINITANVKESEADLVEVNGKTQYRPKSTSDHSLN